MFDEFLETYIRNLIEASRDEYEMTEADIKDVIYTVKENEHIWDELDNAIFEELHNYIKEDFYE